MTNRKCHIRLWFLLAAGLLTGCTADTPVPEDTPKEIQFEVSTASQTEATRVATLYESTTALQSEMTHGGEGSNYIHVDAYLDGTTTKYIDNSRIFYFNGASSWRFANASGNIIHFYWPMDDAYLNFLAYAPLDLTYTGVTIGTYTDRHPTFNCDLPITNNQTYANGTINMKEFIYSYVTGKNKSNDGESAVPLGFIHPFAAVYLKVDKAKQRMALNNVTFKRIYKKGTGAYNSTGPTTGWTPDTSDGTADFTLTIGKTMGTDMFTGDTYGPFIVMPQNMTGRAGLDDIKMIVNYTPYGGSATNSAEATITSETSTTWVAGKKYT